MEEFLVKTAMFVSGYLIMGLFFWIAIPTLENSSGQRPVLWKIMVAWAPVAFLPRSGLMIKEWMWRK